MEDCIFIDWGTTNARSYWVDGDGGVRDSRQSDLGILNLGDLGVTGAFDVLTSGWIDAKGARPPVLMSGMIGSRQGWTEAAYAPCPAALTDLAAKVMAVPEVDDVWIVPGVCLSPDGPRRDVIRGEEVQIFGALEVTGRASTTLCLPGTHSKWARVEDARLVDFATAMTGEVFHVMRAHSILGALLSADADHDAGAFAKGLGISATEGGLLNHLFSVRAEGLFGVMAQGELSSYLSGLLLGHEIRDMAAAYPADGAGVLLVGSSGLVAIYGEAFEFLGIPFQTLDGEKATISGLISLWSSLREDIHG